MTITEKPIFLALKNAHEHDKNITFDEGPHIYEVNGDRSFISCTTWIHSHFSHFDANKIVNDILKKKEMNDPTYKYYGMSRKEIIDSWDKNRDLASGAGTKMHYDIECYYNDIPVKNDSIEFTYFKDFLRDHMHLEAYRTEWCVYYEEIKLSGSIDMVFKDKNTDEFYIYDWKRVKEISFESFKNKCSVTKEISNLPDSNFWHYSLQLNTYKAILEEKYGLKIKGLYLVCLHPDNPLKTYEKIEAQDLSKEVNALFEVRRQKIEQIKMEE